MDDLKQFIQNFLIQQFGIENIHELVYKLKSEETDAYCSEIRKLTVYKHPIFKNQSETNQQNIELMGNYIMKIPSNSILFEKISKTRLYEKEIFIYEVILPLFEKLLSQYHGVELSSYFAPNYYQNNGHLSFIMSDLRDEGYQMLNCKTEIMDVAILKLTLSKLAQFHAASVKLNEINPEIFDCCKRIWFVPETVANAPDFISRLHSTLTIHLEDFLTTHGKRWENFEKKYIERIRADLNPSNSNFNVLNHSDLHASNLMIKRTPNGEVEDIKFFDFQITNWSNPILDLMYLFMMSTSYEVFQNHGHKLFAHYYHVLKNTMKKLKCARFNERAFVDLNLMKEFEKRSSYGLCIISFYLPFIRKEDPNTSLQMDNHDAMNVGIYRQLAKPWIKYLVEELDALNV